MLLDATYTVSGPRDHSREQIQGSGFLMEKVPTYDNLFSELGHHPSQTFRSGEQFVSVTHSATFESFPHSMPFIAFAK